MNKLKKRPAAGLLCVLLVIILCAGLSACKEKTAAPEEVREFSLPGKYYESAGTATSYLKISEPLEDGGYPATVLWGYTKDQYTEWNMTLYADADGKYSYTDCVCADITVDEGGNLIALTRYEFGSGYFTLGNWTMYWDGAAEEGVRNCVFEK